MVNVVINNYSEIGSDRTYSPFTYGTESKKDITETQFKQALDFLEDSGLSGIKIRGGQPTEHPRFSELILRAVQRETIDQIVLQISGLHEPRINELIYLVSLEQSIQVVVSFHPKETLGESGFQTARQNIRELKKMPNVRLNLRITFWEAGQQYEHLLNEASELGLDHIYWSVRSPKPEEYQNMTSEDYLESLSDTVFNFLREASNRGFEAEPEYSHHPICFFDEDQVNTIGKFGIDLKNFASEPQVDIRPDLTAVRSHDVPGYKVDLGDFEGIQNLHQHFLENVDSEFMKRPIFGKCQDCSTFDSDSRSCPALGLHQPNPLKRDS